MKRYGSRSINFNKYIDLAQKFLMGQKLAGIELKLNLDMIQKSESKIFGAIMSDFIQLQVIHMWSDQVNYQQLEKRNQFVEVPGRLKMEWEQTKLSQNPYENTHFFKFFYENIYKSQKLQILQICGVKLNRMSYKLIGVGVQESMTLKRFMMQNCNLAGKDYLHCLTEGVMNSKSLEVIDLQCNKLVDKHVSSIAKIICSQYEIRDLLRWKLGLRNPETLDINKLGVKCIYLSRNLFSDWFCESLSAALKADEYLKCICLRHNKIGVHGIKCLAEAVF